MKKYKIDFYTQNYDALLGLVEQWMVYAVPSKKEKVSEFQIFRTLIRGSLQNALLKHQVDIALALVYSVGSVLIRRRGEKLRQISGFIERYKRLPTLNDVMHVEYKSGDYFRVTPGRWVGKGVWENGEIVSMIRLEGGYPKGKW